MVMKENITLCNDVAHHCVFNRFWTCKYTFLNEEMKEND